MASVAPASTQVLIAGGGPVGLATAIELGRRDVDCLVVEPRLTVSHTRPRCKTVNVRTLEHLRRWGIAERLRERAPLPVSWSKDIVFCTSLTGHELSRFTGVLGLAAEGDRFAEPGQQAPQYVLEELLRDVADELPTISLARGCRVLGLEQDEGEVRVTIAAEGGEESVVSADFVVGCDGPAVSSAPRSAPITWVSTPCARTSGWCSGRRRCSTGCATDPLSSIGSSTAPPQRSWDLSTSRGRGG